MQEILLNIESKEIRYAVLKNGILYDLIVERKKKPTPDRKYLSRKGD